MRPLILYVLRALLTVVLLGAGALPQASHAAEGADAMALRRKAALDSILSRDLKRHAGALAEDSFEGREAGSRGGHAAGNYLAREFVRLKLQPAGEGDSYFQSFGNGYRNLLGLIAGSDDRLKHEVIVIGAHYDHVGYGSAANSYGPVGYIHNGADDNASGTAALLELAEAFQLHPPRRTVLFALWDAEEKGLLGSKHWVTRPTVSLDRVRFALNMDMVGRLRDNRLEVLGSRTSWGLRQLVARHNQKELEVDFTWELQENSDHHSFYTRSIPVLMPHTGLHRDYHRPSDDSEGLNPEGMQHVVQLAFGILDELANSEQIPKFRAACRRETPEMRKLVEQPLPPLPGRLGVSWDTREQTGRGLLVLRVSPASPAAKAGLRDGDRLLALAGQPLDDGDRFTRLVQMAPAKTVLQIERAGVVLEQTIELAGQPVRIGLSWRMDDAEPGVAIVTRIVPLSPAAAAGLAAGDHIYQVGSHTFTSSDEFESLLAAAEGDVELRYERQGKLRTTRLRLEEAPLRSAKGLPSGQANDVGAVATGPPRLFGAGSNQ